MNALLEAEPVGAVTLISIVKGYDVVASPPVKGAA
jgi:hypothetical protein